MPHYGQFTGTDPDETPEDAFQRTLDELVTEVATIPRQLRIAST